MALRAPVAGVAVAVVLLCLGAGLGRNYVGSEEMQQKLWSSEVGSSMDSSVPTGLGAAIMREGLRRGRAQPERGGLLTGLAAPSHPSARAVEENGMTKHGWQDVRVDDAAIGAEGEGHDGRKVPDLGSVIGAYRQVARMGEEAGQLKGDSSDAMEHAANSLDAIALSMGHKGGRGTADVSLPSLSSNPVGHAGGKSAWDRDHLKAGGSMGEAQRVEAHMVQEQHRSLMDEHVLSHSSMLRPMNLTNCTNCSFFEPFVLNADGTIKLNAKEARMEADLWRRLFGDRYSHGFCAQYHGRAHCRARAEGQWNYDAQTYAVDNPFASAAIRKQMPDDKEGGGESPFNAWFGIFS